MSTLMQGLFMWLAGVASVAVYLLVKGGSWTTYVRLLADWLQATFDIDERERLHTHSEDEQRDYLQHCNAMWKRDASSREIRELVRTPLARLVNDCPLCNKRLTESMMAALYATSLVFVGVAACVDGLLTALIVLAYGVVSIAMGHFLCLATSCEYSPIAHCIQLLRQCSTPQEKEASTQQSLITRLEAPLLVCYGHVRNLLLSEEVANRKLTAIWTVTVCVILLQLWRGMVASAMALVPFSALLALVVTRGDILSRSASQVPQTTTPVSEETSPPEPPQTPSSKPNMFVWVGIAWMVTVPAVMAVIGYSMCCMGLCHFFCLTGWMIVLAVTLTALSIFSVAMVLILGIRRHAPVDSPPSEEGTPSISTRLITKQWTMLQTKYLADEHLSQHHCLHWNDVSEAERLFPVNIHRLKELGFFVVQEHCHAHPFCLLFESNAHKDDHC